MLSKQNKEHYSIATTVPNLPQTSFDSCRMSLLKNPFSLKMLYFYSQEWLSQ